MTMASAQTRIARAAARDAEAEWKQHAAQCLSCSRKGAEPCADGAALRNNVARLRNIARKEAELDKAPAPGQEPLF